MKRMMILLAVLFSPVLFAGQPAQESESRCDKQHAQCMKQCDKEKSFWMFKGEKYDTCAAKCTARQDACAAMPDEAAGGERGNDAHGGHDANQDKDRNARTDHDDDAMDHDMDDDAMDHDMDDDAMEAGDDAADDSAAAEDDSAAGKRNRGRKDRGSDD